MNVQLNGVQWIDQTTSTSTPTANPSVTAIEQPDVLPQVRALENSGDPGAMLAALTMEMGRNQEKTARAERAQAVTAEAKADEAEIADMHDKADWQRAQGIIDGACEVGQGLCDFGAGINEANAATQSGQAEKGSKVAAADDKLGAATFGAARSVSDGLFQGAITDKDADAKARDACAQTLKECADDAHDDLKDAKDLLSKALDFYKEYTDTKNQTMLAATQRA